MYIWLSHFLFFWFQLLLARVAILAVRYHELLDYWPNFHPSPFKVNKLTFRPICFNCLYHILYTKEKQSSYEVTRNTIFVFFHYYKRCHSTYFFLSYRNGTINPFSLCIKIFLSMPHNILIISTKSLY